MNVIVSRGAELCPALLIVDVIGLKASWYGVYGEREASAMIPNRFTRSLNSNELILIFIVQ